jgi:hypothetical protein
MVYHCDEHELFLNGARNMRRLSRAVLILIVMMSGAHAQERFTEPFGGRGGQQFISRCPTGVQLTGISALTGDYVTGIASICDGRQGAGFGGSGNRRSAECPRGSVVSTIFMVSLRSDNHLLKKVTIDCVSKDGRVPTARVDLDTPGRYTSPAVSYLRVPGYPTTTQTCGAQRIVGLQGRAGSAIDALGLICG